MSLDGFMKMLWPGCTSSLWVSSPYLGWKNTAALPETNMAPENRPLGRGDSELGKQLYTFYDQASNAQNHQPEIAGFSTRSSPLRKSRSSSFCGN